MEKVKRNRPQMICYKGLDLWYGAITNSSGEAIKIVISYRAEAIGKRHQVPYGKMVYKREYVLPMPVLSADDGSLPREIVYAVIEKHMLRYLAGLLEVHGSILTPETRWGLIGPYWLYQLHKMRGVSDAVKQRQIAAMEQMCTIWGDMPVREITPDKCADDIIDMSRTVAGTCISLLRQLVNRSFAPWMEDAPWEHYSIRGKGRSFSAQRQGQKLLANSRVWTDQYTADVIAQIINHPCDPRYVVTMIMLISGIDAEEACALQIKDVQPVIGYPDIWSVNISKIIVQAESSVNKRNRQRGRHHIVADIEDGYQTRVLVLGTWASQIWDSYATGKGRADYILHDPRNKHRRMTPNDYRIWLDTQFGVGAETSLIATAYYNMRRYGMRTKVLRYTQGLAPKQTDGRYYLAMRSGEILNYIAQLQGKWLTQLGCSVPCDTDVALVSKGVADKQKRTKVTIKIPPQERGQPLNIKVMAQYGLCIKTKEGD